MLSNGRIHSIIRVFFYLILIGVSFQSWINLIDENSTFVETTDGAEAKIPSFTLCPRLPEKSSDTKLIESFEDVTKEIEDVKIKYTITYLEYKAFEEERIAYETYNTTSNNDWYFAPKIIDIPPFETVVCLIWTPNMKQEVDTGRGISVSSSKVSQSQSIVF